MREKEILDKLDEIVKLLEDIKQNTSPVWTYPICPSVWTQPNNVEIHDNSGGWVQGDDWTHLPPITEKAVCHCEHCKGTTTSIGQGCVKCSCRLVAVYTEDGNWWCNKCHQASFYQDGSPKL